MKKSKGKGKGLPFPPPSWALTAWQVRVYDATESLKRPSCVMLVAGRGAGKDIVAMRCIMRDALKLYRRRLAARRTRAEQMAKGVPVEKGPVLNPLVKIWIAGPQQYNINQAWDDWRGMLTGLAQEWGPLLGHESDQTEWLFREVVREGKFIIFGRGEIEVEQRLTSTRDALRGPGVDLVQWTEAAIETVPGEFERAFREELQGTMTRPGRHGRIYFTTSPKGPFGGFFDECTKRLGDGRFQKVENDLFPSEDGRTLYIHGDSYTNEFFSPDQVEAIQAEKVNGWQYEQERLAKYVIAARGGVKVFEREWVEKCIVPARLERKGWRKVLIGVDIARLGDDETCFVAVDEESGEVLLVEFHAKRLLSETRDDFGRLALMFPGCEFLVDSTGHRGYIKDFIDSRLNATETQFSREKEKWVGGLKMLFQMGKIRIPSPDACEGMDNAEREAIRKLLQQLLCFAKIVKQSGGIEFSHPQGEHDDGVDALMLASMRVAERLQQTLGPKETRDKARRLGL